MMNIDFTEAKKCPDFKKCYVANCPLLPAKELEKLDVADKVLKCKRQNRGGLI